MDPRAGGHNCRRSLVGSRQAKHLVARVKQLADHGRTDESRPAGYEYAHWSKLLSIL
jgi:hypothetical protein